jgi:hypothetical protein
MDKVDVKETLSLCHMFDDYIEERTDLIAFLKGNVLDSVKDKADQVSLMYTIGKLTMDLGFVRSSAYSFVSQVQSKNSDFSFWM